MSEAVINRLSPEQREDFETLVGLAKTDSLGIVHTELDGKPVAVVMTVVEDSENPNDGGMMYPLAILVDEDLVNRLTNPFDEKTEN